MPRAGAGAAARHDLAAIRDIALEPLDVFVIGGADLIGAETADLAPRHKLAPAARPTGAARPAGATATASKIGHSAYHPL